MSGTRRVRGLPPSGLALVLLSGQIVDQGHHTLRMFGSAGHRHIRDVLAVHDESRDRHNLITLRELIGSLHGGLDVEPAVLLFEISIRYAEPLDERKLN